MLQRAMKNLKLIVLESIANRIISLLNENYIISKMEDNNVLKDRVKENRKKLKAYIRLYKHVGGEINENHHKSRSN